MKKVVISVVLLLVCFSLFAAQYHSVPVSDEAYEIIDSAVLRGIIEVQDNVRPYNWNKVQMLLGEIASSGKLSDTEIAEINRIISDLKKRYEKTFGFNAVLTDKAGFSNSDGTILDSRNKITAYFMGDLGNFLSFDLNVQGSLDKIDSNAYLYNDLPFECGFYDDLIHNGVGLTVLPNDNIWVGYKSESELSTDIKDGLLSVRFGSVTRDWGVGDGNFGLSETASSFTGLELSIKPYPWFSYNVLTGSLGKSMLKTVNGVSWPSDTIQNDEYDNNLSIHRVEVTPFKGLQAGIWESVIWRKRFELSYLNPLAIYMFVQNELSDFDNMLFGLDLSLTVPSIGRFYGALGVDEMNSFSGFLTNPRNELAVQLGYETSLNVLSFTKLGVQLTYVPAFFGSHYKNTKEHNPYGNTDFETCYVNKGKALGYAVHPDTLEFKGTFDTVLSRGLKLNAVIKDQMRSAQYSKDEFGTTILTVLDYSKTESYAGRAFFDYVWHNVLDCSVTCEKTFDRFPVTLTLGLDGMLESSRSFTPDDLGKPVMGSDWTNEFTLTAVAGCRISYRFKFDEVLAGGYN